MKIIDFHTHTFPARIAPSAIAHLQSLANMTAYTDSTPESLMQSMKSSGITYSVTLPVMTNTRQVEKLNTLAIEAVDHYQETGLIPFGGMHPDYENYSEELKRLVDHGIRGIKLHPPYQSVDFDDIRFLRILDKASELGLIILVHAGWDIGIPGHNYTSVAHIEHVIDEVHPEKLVLAHMGGWNDWDASKKYLAGMPVYMDTAFTLGRIEAAEGKTRGEDAPDNMQVSQFLELARAHGLDRILFATDCPWGNQETYVKLFQSMGLRQDELNAVFFDNAAGLLGLSL